MNTWLVRSALAAGLAAATPATASAGVLQDLVKSGVAAAARAAGYDVTYADLTHGPAGWTLVSPAVANAHGEPILRADALTVGFSIWQLRSAHPFGITRVELDRPRLTIVRHPDGTYNVPLPGPSTGPAKPFSLPWIDVVVRGGEATLEDPSRIHAASRRLAITGLELDAALDPAARSTYRLALALVEGARRYPVTGSGVLDDARGFESGRFTARVVGLAPLLNYAIDSRSLFFGDGELRDLDARLYGLRGPGGAMRRHLAATTRLARFRPYLAGLAKPLRDGHGPLALYDDGLAIERVDGSIAGVPVRIAGGIYGLAKPAVRLGIRGRGDLRRLLTLSAQARAIALSGPLAFDLLVEGDATSPTTLASFDSPRLRYGKIPLDHPSGMVALAGPETAILRTRLAYQGVSAGARGDVLLERTPRVRLVATVAAPVARLPYAASLLGPMTVAGTALVTGSGSALETRAVLAGATATTSLAGLALVDGRGEGAVGPLSFSGPGGERLSLEVALDRPNAGGGAVFIAAHDLRLSTEGPQPALAGLALPPVPAVRGTLDGAVAGSFAGNRYALGVDAVAHDVVAFGYPVTYLAATGAVGDGARAVLHARYRGSLAPIARAAGGKFAASGDADLPVDVLSDGSGGIVAQLGGATLTDVRVGGARVGSLSGTVAVRGSAVRVYAARAAVDGARIVAQGSFGDGGALHASAAGIDLAGLPGVPVRSGTLSALATVTGTAARPAVAAGVAVTGVRSTNRAVPPLPVDASTNLRFAGDRLALDAGTLSAGAAVGYVDGTVDGVRTAPASARYDVAASLANADVATLASYVKSPLRYPEGTVDAHARIVGRGSAALVDGEAAIPEGSLNGLAFRDAAVRVAGTAARVRIREGRVTVGSSHVGFRGAVTPGEQRFAIAAPRLDLADFNDYFDRGDTLGGTGSARADLDATPDRIVTSGDVHVANARYRRFTVGAVDAGWRTAGRTVVTNATVRGRSGSAAISGGVTLAATAPQRDALGRSAIALDAHARGVDLGVYLPAAGFTQPVFGLLSADARVRGTYPDLDARASASLANGKVGAVAIRTAALAASATRGRATLDSAAVAVDGLTVTARGSASLRPNGPIALRAEAVTPDVGLLAKTAANRTVDASGAATVVALLSGTAKRPLAELTLDASDLRSGKLTIPRASADVALTQASATLRRGEVDFTKGSLRATGFAPLRGTPPRVAPATAPIGLDLVADAIDLGQFGALLPKGTTLAGTVAGTVGLTGTLARPGLRGTVALAGGTFRGPQERSPITDLHAALTFAGTRARLHDAGASVGGGTVAATGRFSVPSLRAPARDLAASLQLTATNAVVDAPQYLKGRLNGTLTFARTPDAVPVLGGTLALDDARIPLSAVFNPSAPQVASTAAPLPLDLALAVDVGRDVRVQSGQVDVGGTGSIGVGGSLAAPALSGRIESVGGGSLSFYRTFALADYSTVSFDPSDGAIPTIDATATTTLTNPDADVTLHVTGPATMLNVGLTSDPAYSRTQILGLLVGLQAFGAVSGIASTTGGPQANPFQSLAEGQLGTLLTRNVLEPLSSTLGGAVGLSNLDLGYTPGGGVNIGARRKIFRDVSVVYSQSFDLPRRESVGIVATPKNGNSALQATFFTQPGANQFSPVQTQSLITSNPSVSAGEPTNGTQGFSISLQRKFR